MSEKLIIRLRDAQQGYQGIQGLWQYAKPLLMAGTRLVGEVRGERRSLDQNAKFHALCSDLAKSGLEWMGKRRTAMQWKVLLVSGHAIATKEETEMVLGLEGEFVNLRESTASMGVKRSASLIEYTQAFMSENGVPVMAGKQWDGWDG